MVRADSAFRSFADLRGAALAYNDAGSFTGYAVLGAHLAALGETIGYFGRVVQSGAHLQSLQLIAQGLVDTAAIDSVVLELELARCAELAAQFRVVEAIGPSPIPLYRDQAPQRHAAQRPGVAAYEPSVDEVL